MSVVGIRFVRLVAIAAVVSVGTSACATSAPQAFTVPTASPLPSTTVPAGPVVTPIKCAWQDAVKSYRPTSPLPSPGQFPAGSYMETIYRRGHLTVGTSADVLQFGARNPFTGEIEGFDVEMLKQVSLAIFGDDRALDFKIINYAQRIPTIRDGTADIVAHTMTINCTRWTQVAFSTEYYHAGQKVLVRSDSSATSIKDLAGKKVCVAKGSTNIDNLKQYPAVVAVPVDDLGTCLVLFQQGAVDAITGDDTVLAGFKAQDHYAIVIGDRFSDEPYGLAMSLKHRDFVEFVNSLLERMRSDGTLARLYCKWLPCVGGKPPTPLPAAAYGR